MQAFDCLWDSIWDFCVTGIVIVIFKNVCGYLGVSWHQAFVVLLVCWYSEYSCKTLCWIIIGKLGHENSQNCQTCEDIKLIKHQFLKSHRIIFLDYSVLISVYSFIIMSQDHYSGFIPFWCRVQTDIIIPFVALLSFYAFIRKVMYHPSFIPIRNQKGFADFHFD